MIPRSANVVGDRDTLHDIDGDTIVTLLFYPHFLIIGNLTKVAIAEMYLSAGIDGYT